jgi:hypothetical protein
MTRSVASEHARFDSGDSGNTVVGIHGTIGALK